MSASGIKTEKGLIVIDPLLTLGLGIIISALFGWVAGHLTKWVFVTVLEYRPAIGIIAYWVAILGSGAYFLSAGYCHRVEVGHMAVPRFLGKRLSWFLLSEGLQWLPPGIMDKLIANMQVHTSKEHVVTELVSKNGIDMDGGYVLIYQVVNPFRSFDAHNAMEALEEVADGALRDSFSSRIESELYQEEVRSRIGEEMTERMADTAHAIGYEVHVVLTMAQPPEEVLKANAALSVEIAQKASEQTEMDGLIAKIRQLKDEGFSREKAVEILGAERGKTPTTRYIHKLEGIEPILENPVVQQLLERIFSQKGD